MSAEKIYLALPSYDGRIEAGMLPGLNGMADAGVPVFINPLAGSALAYSFNRLYCDALNKRKAHGITHFAMMHADVEPEANWLQVMLREMKENKADLLSAVIAIKGGSGETSTALDLTEGEGEIPAPFVVRRLPLTEIEKLSKTFTHEKILVNSGLMILDIRKDWAEKVCFTLNDKIIKKKNGEFFALMESEDWCLSRQVRSFGGTVFATRAVKVNHVGKMKFPNFIGQVEVSGSPTTKG